jgi:hypothetical protein
MWVKYWWRKPEYSEKTTDLSQVTEKLEWGSNSRIGGFELTTLVVRGTDCTVSYQSSYHMIVTMTAPPTWVVHRNCWNHDEFCILINTNYL